jgi:hypothetical protein
MDLSHVVEGHLEHSRLLTRSEHQLIERRLDALSRGQEQIVGLLESLVTRLEQGPMTPEVSHDGDTPPVATYDQMYGRISDPAATSNDPAVTPESTPVKRSWRPW